MPEPEVAPEPAESARRSAAALEEAEERFALFYEHCPLGVVLADADRVIGAVNPAFLRLTGASSEDDVIGVRVDELGDGYRNRSVLGRTLDGLEPGGKVVEQLAIGAADEDVRFVRLTATTLSRDSRRHTILMFEDVHELRRLQETFQHQALHDPLTGLPNGVHFRTRLETLLAARERGRIAVLFLDVDGFKVVNDGLGTEVADLVLRGVAGTLRTVFAEDGAFVARLFGDGFAVALHGDLEPAAVVNLAELAIGELAKPVYVDDIGVGVSASVGIVVSDVPGAEYQELIRSAEVALHRAKELGKAQWVLFDPQAGRTDRHRYRLASAIAGALELGEISVSYQPHVVLPDARIVTSLSAVLLWNHPAHGPIRAEKFFPLAEMTGMTVPLGKYLLAEALRTKAEWQARFGDGAPMVCLTLPRRMAIDADLVGIVRAELAHVGLEPRHLMLCAEADALLDERGDLVESLGHLCRLGVLFILVITGLPDLELIPDYRVSARGVLLTGQLVDVLGDDDPPEPARRNVRRVVERAGELGLKVGALGVRSKSHADALCDLGVMVGGGTYLPEHLSREEAEIWVGRTFPLD
ncbi:diguanylate cyclase domain-containing protein [Amycolatopsis pittospori]|uniref:diguanylate cyclase domain-containing protein n=1 Tax=Amycolatopsis pittospori TaxID=2749434 RepID=UPI0015F096D8|nr:diguanylate cyclase [Amycolatopsis pittospori]